MKNRSPNIVLLAAFLASGCREWNAGTGATTSLSIDTESPMAISLSTAFTGHVDRLVLYKGPSDALYDTYATLRTVQGYEIVFSTTDPHEVSSALVALGDYSDVLAPQSFAPVYHLVFYNDALSSAIHYRIKLPHERGDSRANVYPRSTTKFVGSCGSIVPWIRRVIQIGKGNGDVGQQGRERASGSGNSLADSGGAQEVLGSGRR